MKKIFGIALASNVLFFSNAMAQTSEPDLEFEFSEDSIIDVCESNAKSLQLDEDAIDDYINQCISDNSNSIEETTEELEEPEELE